MSSSCSSLSEVFVPYPIFIFQILFSANQGPVAENILHICRCVRSWLDHLSTPRKWKTAVVEYAIWRPAGADWYSKRTKNTGYGGHSSFGIGGGEVTLLKQNYTSSGCKRSKIAWKQKRSQLFLRTHQTFSVYAKPEKFENATNYW